jgi:hypothetical protein
VQKVEKKLDLRHAPGNDGAACAASRPADGYEPGEAIERLSDDVLQWFCSLYPAFTACPQNVARHDHACC